MDLVAWNVRWGGQDRQERIASVIADRAPDVVVLTEYQPRGSARLIVALGAAGWVHQELTDPPPRFGGVAILSKHPLVRQPLPATLAPFASRYLPVSIPSAGVEVRGIYGLLHKEPHAEYWTAVLDALEAGASRDVLVVGDFNTGESGVDTPVKNFFCSGFFCELPRRGYTDLWRQCAGREAREYSWQGRVNPYRLDHAFGTPSIVRRLRECAFSHEERLAGISDHSLLTVRLAS